MADVKTVAGSGTLTPESMLALADLSRLSTDELFKEGEYCANGTADPYARLDLKARDMPRATECYRLAMTRGHPLATFRYARATAHGWGRPKSDDEAFQYFAKSVELGVTEANVSLAVCYNNAYGVEKNAAKSIELYEMMVARGSAWACCNYALCLELRPPAPDETPAQVRARHIEARKLYERAAAGGFILAQYYSGMCYLDEGMGVDKPDDKKAFEYLVQAASGGHAASQLAVGLAYRRGTGVAADDAKAMRYYEMAAAQNHPVALCNIGIAYENAWGVKKNDQKAYEYYQRAADLHHATSQYYIGLGYVHGHLPAPNAVPDPNAAFAWFVKAATNPVNPSPDAQRDLSVCYRKGLGVPAANEREAMKWLISAAAAGHRVATIELAEAYELGTGVNKNLRFAVERYRKIIELKETTKYERDLASLQLERLRRNNSWGVAAAAAEAEAGATAADVKTSSISTSGQAAAAMIAADAELARALSLGDSDSDDALPELTDPELADARDDPIYYDDRKDRKDNTMTHAATAALATTTPTATATAAASTAAPEPTPIASASASAVTSATATNSGASAAATAAASVAVPYFGVLPVVPIE